MHPGLVLFLALTLGGLVVGCSGEAVGLAPDGTEPAPTVLISGPIEVEIGHELLLRATTEGAEDHGYRWRTGDDRIASVDARGVLTGLFAGEVTITVVGLDSGLSADHTVTVTDASQVGP